MELNIENLMNTAIQEMKNGQHSEASKHFDLVVINDSANIDAPFSVLIVIVMISNLVKCLMRL